VSGSLDPGQVRGIVEAVLMTADAPVTPGRLEAVLKGVKGSQLRQAVNDLNERYREGGHAMTIAEVAGGYQLVTLKEFAPWLRKFHDRSHVRLSQAALETLAIVAFKQPVTRIEVDNLRGVDSAGVVRNLLELNLVRIVGRSEGLGRPMLFGTTRDFMTHFGLRSLADLPKPKELEELLAEGERKAREDSGNGRLEDVAAEPDSTEEDLPEVGGRIEAGEELEAPEEGSGEDSRS
jgi:segregation and condensation protein B